MLMSPNVERRRRSLIYQRNSKSKPRQIHPLDVMLACITSFDPYVVVFGSVKITQFGWPLFTTISAGHAPERPVHCASCTDKISIATVRSRVSDLKETYLRHTATEWTASFSTFEDSRSEERRV